MSWGPTCLCPRFAAFQFVYLCSHAGVDGSTDRGKQTPQPVDITVSDLEALALRFIKSSIHEELALAYAARGAGGERLRAGVEELKDQQHRVERDLLDRGVKPRPFPKLPAMLKAVEQDSAYWNCKLGSMAVHTSRLALEATRERREDGVSTRSDEGSDRSIV